ncbi:MAG TPA: XylR N-terminal domain-containing protein [Candidatus Sabulitectum sp.]|nr:XylR N-terminal domain-containing protein [Candidatus Sabulitectum sp.]HPR21732.1 XylR N-terminal domain-containing protein [Candidatus Sabulitectum sp.]HRW77806.1 XylR N-terminal domain-containing protein [Candidatus Sabulitectum sp.]
MARYVNSSDDLAPLFTRGEDIVTPIFWDFKRQPEKGSIHVSGERYVLFRSSSMASALHQQLKSVLGPGADVAIYQTGKSIGADDASYYLEKTRSGECSIRLAVGPVTFAFQGLAKVNILEDSSITPDEDFLLVYEHPNAFEAEAVMQRGIQVDGPVDFFNAGYSAGWCSEACGLKLEAKEIACRAMGHETCRFVMAPVKRLRERVKQIQDKYPL